MGKYRRRYFLTAGLAIALYAFLLVWVGYTAFEAGLGMVRAITFLGIVGFIVGLVVIVVLVLTNPKEKF